MSSVSMTKAQAKERIEKLRQLIAHYRYQYHVLNKADLSEAALDALKHELYTLEQQYPELITPDSPTQRVAGAVLDKFKKITHKVRQWSFEDIFNLDELNDFDQRLKNNLDKQFDNAKFDYVTELKIDGLKAILTYENGVLLQAATRGDGVIGEDVTHNIKTIESIPLRLRKPVDIVVEGEVFMSKTSFNNLNEAQIKAGKPEFANPRNVAAGSIRQLDPKVAAERDLDCFIYDLSAANFDLPNTQIKELKLLKELGFKTNPHYKLCKSVDDIMTQWQYWKDHKEQVDYWIDGLVIKVNQLEYQKYLGYTGKAPRWGRAFKFPAEQTTTVVEDIILSVGRLGTITPIAALRPVNIAGTVVKRATLHNEDRIKELGLKIGDSVVIQKAGDIIPEVVKVLPELRTGSEKEFKMPSNCPVCNSAIKRSEGEAAWICTNPDCYAQEVQKLGHFISKKGLNIEGIGPRILEVLIEQGLIKNYNDLFTLEESDIVPLERFAEKSANNVINSIESARSVLLPKFIFALGIRYIGEGASKLMSAYLQSSWKQRKVIKVKDLVSVWEQVSLEEWEAIDGIGIKAGQALYDYIHNEKYKQQLLALNEWLSLELPLQGNDKFNGQTFVLTGELATMTRDEAKELIEFNGGKVSSSVSKKTSYVVVGENPGSKYKKSRELGIKILNEQQFKDMIK